MRKILAIVILTLGIGIADARTKSSDPRVVNKEVLCFTGQDLFKTLRDKYGEKPVFLGRHKHGGLVVFFNQTTKTYTVLEFNETTSCAISIGGDAELMDLDPTTTKNSL